MGGVAPGGKRKNPAFMVRNLPQSVTLWASSDLPDNLLRELKLKRKVLTNRMARAERVVMKSPDIPPALVETALITNP